ncbi:MAG: hypothetical protein PVI97_00290 [Candidatus Thiodiazotropha sp.]|jgi:hypothetical protein
MDILAYVWIAGWAYTFGRYHTMWGVVSDYPHPAAALPVVFFVWPYLLWKWFKRERKEKDD